MLLIVCVYKTSLAKVGDMYICQMLEQYSTEVPLEGVGKWDLEPFTFKREKDYITIFTKEEYGFARGTYDVYGYIGSENFKAKGWQTLISYHNNFHGNDVNESGCFNYVKLGNWKWMTTAGAICNILKWMTQLLFWIVLGMVL